MKSVLKKGLKAIMVTAIPLTMTALAACGNSQQTSGSATNQSSNNKVIKVAYQQFGAPPIWGEEWLKKAKSGFEKSHPGVTIQLEPIQASENDFYTKIDLMMKSEGTAPDVVTEDTFLINSDASAGYLSPMNDYVNKWSDWSQFSDAMKAGSTGSDGNVYGVPYSTDTRGIWYDANIFKKAGLPVPFSPKNWDDVLTAAKTIKEKVPGVIPFWAQAGKATGEATTMQTFEMLLYGTNDTLYDESSKKWVVKSPGFLDSLKFIQTIYSKGLGPQLSQVLNGQAGNTESQQLMPKEQIGMALDGNWIPGSWKDGGPAAWKDGTKTYQLAAMPTQNGQDPGFTSMSGGWALSISKLAKNKDLAAQFIEYAVNKDNDKWYVIQQGNLSPRTDVASDPEYVNAPGQEFGPATAFTKFTHFRPANPQYPSVSTAIQTAVESVATGSATPQQAMDQYSANVQRIVGANNTVTK